MALSPKIFLNIILIGFLVGIIFFSMHRSNIAIDILSDTNKKITDVVPNMVTPVKSSQPESDVQTSVIETEGSFDPPGIAPCGEVCSYGGTVINPNGKFYPQIRKNIDCNNIMKRMAFTDHKILHPPPEVPPSHLLKAYTMNGKMPITKFDYYKPASFATVERSFSLQDMQTLIDQSKAGVNVNTYDDKACALHYVGNSSDLIKGHGVVIGSLRPWLESMLLANGADRLTTLEYANIHFDHPQMDSYTPYNFANNYIQGKSMQFDFAASFSSLEHSGIGRYTDPLNPYGDLEAMAQVWCMLKPGGIFILGLPGSITITDRIFWNANRVYGSIRMPQMAANFEVLDRKPCPMFDHFIHTIRKIN